ncbi:MAG TPA: hypothetical protein PKK96_00545 [Anaerolineales bacterium]|nr:hypothetical protein [Anaerolineales bacterium]HNQ95884.1 hypothetical protein [Anaerolineales bacterium]HNS59463.1 hypothetical protein [Anaerolineales bacterium]
MDKDPVTIPVVTTVADFSARVARDDPQAARRQGTPIVDAKGAPVK